MLNFVGELRDHIRRDPWKVLKFIVITLLIGAIGKLILVSVVDGANVPKILAQFAPTLPVMGMTFVAHRYIWGQNQLSIRSYLGKHWTKAYAVQFAAGHLAFLVFAVLVGLPYLVVSIVIGFVSGAVFFSYNELKLFTERRQAKTAET